MSVSTRKLMGRWFRGGKKYKPQPYMRRFAGVQRNINNGVRRS